VLIRPNIFPTNQRIPQEDDFVEFDVRHSDTTNTKGIVLVVAGVFMGWIRKEEITMIRPRIEAGEKLAGKLSHIREYHWAFGKGMCYKGQLTLYIIE
jgi:hypothetical protein